MDSTSQKSDDDFINEFGRSCSCSTLSDATFGVSSGCCAKEMVAKLMAQLKEKDKEMEEIKIQQEKDKMLEVNKEYIKELLANLDLEKIRAVQAIPGMDKLKTELAIAHKTISDLQMAFWKSFPSPHIYYHIKAPSGNGEYGYLNADANFNDYLYSSTGDHPLKGYFQFAKDSDGTFSIYSKAKAKYLQIQTSSNTFAASVMFRADVNHKSKFALIFHPQQDKQLAGILVDILSLANRCYLSPEVNHLNRFAANSLTAPANKFLIIPEDEA